MEREKINQFRLGIFTLTGLLLLAGAIYMIGLRRNHFGNVLMLEAIFSNVNGLQPGNNVRFGGTDAGSVESVEVLNDTAIRVIIRLDKDYGRFIRQDAIASIGTDGLMGNKLINIANTPGSNAAFVAEGSVIRTIMPVETDEMMRTLNLTNNYVSEIALNLKNITNRIGNDNSTIWKLLGDTVLAGVLDTSLRNFGQASSHIAALSEELGLVVSHINHSKGLFGTLMKDTLLSEQLRKTMRSLDQSAMQAESLSGELGQVISDLEDGKGPLGVMLRDSTLSDDLRISIGNIRQSSETLKQSLEALRNNPKLRKYFSEPAKKPAKK